MMAASKDPLKCEIPKPSLTRGYDSSTNQYISMWQFDLDPNQGVPVPVLKEIYHRKRLSSNVVLELKDVVLAPTKVYLVCEEPGWTLREVIDESTQARSVKFLRLLAHGLLSALMFLHSKDTAHGALTPDAVHIGESGEVKLSHFYHANSPSALPYTHYQAPEALLDGAGATHAGDLWAVGCILAETAARRPLFLANTRSALLAQLEVQVKPLSGAQAVEALAHRVPDYPCFPHFLAQLLQWLPEKRSSAEAALRHPFLRNEPYST